MAAGLAPELAHAVGWALDVRSRGTSAVAGLPAEPRAVAACAELGVALNDHRAARLTADDVAWADVIFVMEDAHALAVRALDAAAEERIVRLGPYVGKPEIEDPYGSWFMAPYRRTRDTLTEALRRWIELQS
jgi:protein-tyrosine-phosphatase